MAKVDIKTCRFKNCKHSNNEIDLRKDEYIKVGKLFYHKDCYEKKNADEERARTISADMQLIKNLWIENINQTVVISVLFKVLREYLDRGVSSDYLVFVMQYVISHHCKLNHPFGFRYYIDKENIKEEYRKKIKSEIPKSAFNVIESQEEVQEKQFSAPKKLNGFSSILGGKR